MSPCEMHKNVGLGFGGCHAVWMAAGEGHTNIGVLLALGIRRMCLGHVLQIGRFLNKLLVRAVCATEFEILNVLGLYMIIHGVLLCTALVAILALEMTGKLSGIQLEIRGVSGHKGHDGGRNGAQKLGYRRTNNIQIPLEGYEGFNFFKKAPFTAPKGRM
jgi:hypothetical protein